MSETICPFCFQFSCEHRSYYENNIIMDAWWECTNCKKSFGCTSEYWYQGLKDKHKFTIIRNNKVK